MVTGSPDASVVLPVARTIRPVRGCASSRRTSTPVSSSTLPPAARASQVKSGEYLAPVGHTG
jgi:hypothetical protein